MRPLALALVILSAAAPAAAQDVQTARLVFERGLAAADRGDDAEAERAFRASLELRWSASAAFNLAELLMRRSDGEEARGLFTRVVDDAGTPESVRVRARARLAEIQAASDEGRGRTEPGAEAGGGVDEVALGLALGGGLGATGAFAALAGVYWAFANDTYQELADGCATDCRALADRGYEQVSITNLFIAAALVGGAITLVSVVVVLATASGSDEAVTLRVVPGYASVTGSF